MKGKYKLTRKTLIYEGRTLRRVKYSNGTLGGWIESERNLSQEGECRVLNEAKVYGDAEISENATVMDLADVGGKVRVSGNARLYESAKVVGEAQEFVRIYGNARVYGYSKVTGFTEMAYGPGARGPVSSTPSIFGNARVFGSAKVIGDVEIYDHASVSGNANLHARNNARVRITSIGADGQMTFERPHVKVHGSAQVFGTAELTGSAEVSGTEEVSSGKRSETEKERLEREASEARKRQEALAREQARRRQEDLERAKQAKEKADRAAKELADKVAQEKAQLALEARKQKQRKEVISEIIYVIKNCPTGEKDKILGKVATLLSMFDSDEQRKILDLYSEWRQKEDETFAPERSRIECQIGELRQPDSWTQIEGSRKAAPRIPGGFGMSRSRMDDFMEDLERARMARDIARWSNPPPEAEY
ncbi:hypothetical protein [Streptomyces sp. SP2-10]|uniref:hypothetical protein n=1 Tax=Streptomyces sp. SP2-10 TaxID=2873385 RepID=UPI001CA78760|nr:hypothetical protein [Streptomyces sp. SP2-10]MBY8841910.1 hypothetical protein [Streptomyces sp. SP2-10]